jgi:hypothetical protein
MAIEILQIDRIFSYYLKHPDKNRVSDFELFTFEQIWEILQAVLKDLEEVR